MCVTPWQCNDNSCFLELVMIRRGKMKVEMMEEQKGRRMEGQKDERAEGWKGRWAEE